MHGNLQRWSLWKRHHDSLSRMQRQFEARSPKTRIQIQVNAVRNLKSKMNPLVLWMLKRFCDKHELDPQEIDDTLTYQENKEQLKSLLPYVDPGSNDWRGVDLWRAEEEVALCRAEEQRYRSEHFLHYYIMCVLAGETVSEDVGPVPVKSTGFSLAAYIKLDIPKFFPRKSLETSQTLRRTPIFLG